MAVNIAGSIGFIGLIVPHLVRLAAGNDLRLVLPVGVLKALLGVPVFLYLLSRQPERSGP